MIYVIGIANDLVAKGWNVVSVVMSVIQPRGYHHLGPIRTWTITRDELVYYMNELRSGVDKINSPERKCITGPWCRRCKHMSFCNAAKAAGMTCIGIGDQKVLQDADHIFTDFTEISNQFITELITK